MKNANNLKLIALLGGLVLIFVAIRVFRSPSLESNLPKTLATIDSTKVTAIIIKSPRAQSEIKLARSGKRWELKSGDRTGRLEQGGAITALRSLMDLQPQRIVSKRKEKWNDFQVGDSTGTRVTVMEGDDVEADLWIGKTGFTPAPGNNGQFGGSGFTHVRLNGENEVYTVDGFLEGQFNRGFNDWRDKRFTRLLRDSVDKIVFRYPADSSFTLEKRNGRWLSGAGAIDSTKVTSYLSGLEYKNLMTFSEVTPAGPANATIVLENKSKPVATLEAWMAPGSWILRSTYQPETFFSSEGSSVMKDVWVGKGNFLKKLP